MERERRKRIKQESKLSAFEKLKQIKTSGVKNKYEVGAVENVYEEISEKEYTERVLLRQEDDWIVGDGLVGGYVEDGREIFDDDLDEESVKKGQKSKKRDRTGAHKTIEGPKGNIQKMLSNMPITKKKQVKLDDDEVLDSLMSELDNTTEGSGKTNVPRLTENDEKIRTEEYLKSFAAPVMRVPKQAKNVPKKQAIIETKPEENNGKCDHKTNNDTSINFDDTDINFDDADINFDDADINFDDTMIIETESKSINGRPNDTVATIDDKVMNETEPEVIDRKCDSKIDIKIQSEVINGKCDYITEDIVTNFDDTVTNNEDIVTKNSSPDVDINGSLKFFYWDAFEDPFTQPGTIYLFGKIKMDSQNSYGSCCIIVKNIPRRVFFLPREKRYDMIKKIQTDEDVKMIDVYKEFNDKFAEKHKIMKFKSRKVTKHYAFNIPNVPDTCEYLEVRYPASDYPLPATLQGETFSHVFGTNTGYLELFLIERKIKGPCWLTLTDPVKPHANASWCKFEFECDDMSKINLCKDGGPFPPLTIMSLNIRATPIPKSHDNQITMIGCLIHDAFHADKTAPNPYYEKHFCLFTKPTDTTWPYDSKTVLAEYTKNMTGVQKCDSERELLSLFMAKYYKIDPDLIVGHDILGFDIGTLIHRLVTQKIQQWSKLGRLRRANTSNIGKGKTYVERNIMCGRLMCDIKISAKELIRSRSYNLGDLCEQILKIDAGTYKEVKGEEIKAMFEKSKSVIQIIKFTMQDAEYILRIMYNLNVIPLSLQITNIAGNVLSRTLMGGRSERNEFLLLHAFNDKNYIVPDKVYGKKTVKDDVTNGEIGVVSKGKRKPQYEGGLVLEPKKGFYDRLILLMDFNSLYPSIIQEYNICFTTISVRGMDCGNEEDLVLLMEHLPSDKEPGILPTEIKKLVDSRREVKKLMAASNISADLKHQYNIRQTALKLTANSMYGCLGFPNSRFYAKLLAAMVTAKGREILMNTRDLVQKLNFDVIYGDTDSLMINTNSTTYDDVFNIGKKIKAEVNKLYRRIELDIDGVFSHMLLLKKKKYAAKVVTKENGELKYKTEMKGLDMVRRDWSQLSSATGKVVLDFILEDQSLDDKISNILAQLNKIKTELEEPDRVPLPLLAITKQLTKNPEDYPDKKALPHVQVAIRMNLSMAKKFKQGDTIAYVICEDGTNNSAIQRAYHVNEYEARKTADLKIDVKYYLSQQIHPVVSRLCEPIDGIDAIQIAEALGLDASAYQHARRVDTANDEDDEIALDDVDRYKNCENFRFNCLNPACGITNVIESPAVKNDDGTYSFVLDRCTNVSCSEKPFSYVSQLQNIVWMRIREYVKKYYAGWMYCDDPTCEYRTRNIIYYNKLHEPECPRCRKNKMIREYTESQLFHQLCYYQYMFDISSAISKNKALKKDKDDPSFKAYIKLKEQVDEALKINAYNIIDLRKVWDLILTK